MKYKTMPRRVDWSLLITLLQETYKYGDGDGFGGLPADTNLRPDTLARAKREGLHHWSNGVSIWNVAVERLSDADIERCILIDEPLGGGLGKRERVA